MSDVKAWRKYFKDFGVRDELIESYMKYVERMLNTNLPIIFEFQHLAALLGRTNEYLASVVNSPESHYRTFQIPKRKGGYRTIAAPYPALLQCQQWINLNILNNLLINTAAHGFVFQRSIVTNAKPHLAKPMLLKMDLADFFSTISIRRITSLFKSLGYPKNVSIYLSTLCCLNGVLPQGAATSPMLSNIIVRSLDMRLNALAHKFQLHYTRYADDLTFSGEYIPNKFIGIVEEITKDEGFLINPKKTNLAKDDDRKVVTGLSVKGAILKIPRNYKRKLRQEVHYILRVGYFSHVSKLKIRNPFYIDSVYGKLMFWKLIEPENSFVNEMLPKIGELRDFVTFGNPNKSD